MRIHTLVACALVGAVFCRVSLPVHAQGEPHPDEHSQLHNADGSWKYTNHLAGATSPYLLQHAHNPVDWYPWGRAALKAAKEQDKPIFLSVGYSTCYWCHVMEREVFENPEIAAMMNANFICIKVDREQRPDIDEVYMTATQLMTQRGGWPMSVFMTPDLEPFYTGTYFGATDRGGQPGFPTLLTAMHEAWINDHDNVLDVSSRVTQAVREVLLDRLAQVPPAALDHSVADRAVLELAARYDERWGGFGVAPKFPQGFTYPLLFDVYQRTNESNTLDMAVNSLRKMAAGGMYDHVGGGFHRYSTDGQWRVPHFEKMLYNQAQLAIAYSRAFELTGDQTFAEITRGILRFVAEHMTGPDGQFYSALDAETDAVEGAYYVWNRQQLTELLSQDQLAFFDQVFALADVPIYAGHLHPEGGTLYMPRPLVEVAADLNKPYAELRASVDQIVEVLKTARDQRKLPRLDDKVVAGWNGLMIGAYAQAGVALNEPAYMEAARRDAGFVLEHMRGEDGSLMRVWRGGVSEQPAFQEDYAFVVQGLAALARATGEQRWLDAATDLADRADMLFWDAQAGGYYFAADSPDLIARSKSSRDNAIPSGNSAMANALLELAELTRNDRWLERARDTLETFSGVNSNSPAGSLHMVRAIERLVELVGPIPPAERVDDESAAPLEPMVPIEDHSRGAQASTDSASHVKIEASLVDAVVRAGDTFTVRINLEIDKGWHVNANPASSVDLVATTAEVRSELPIEVVQVTYPHSTHLQAAYSQLPIDVFEGSVVIHVTCRLAAEDNSKKIPSGEPGLRVLVGFQACDAQSCLAPAQRIIEIPVQIAR